jgi:hypothetical protein
MKAVVVQDIITSAVPVNWASPDIGLGIKPMDGVGLSGEPTLITIVAIILLLKLTSSVASASDLANNAILLRIAIALTKARQRRFIILNTD